MVCVCCFLNKVYLLCILLVDYNVLCIRNTYSLVSQSVMLVRGASVCMPVFMPGGDDDCRVDNLFDDNTDG